MKKNLFLLTSAVVIGLAAFMLVRFINDKIDQAAELREIELDLGLRPDPLQTKDFSQSQIETLFGSRSVYDIIANADYIDVWLIRSDDVENNNWDFASVSDYPIEEGPIRLPTSKSEIVCRALTDARNYGWNTVKDCWLKPCVKMTCVKDDQSVEILYCFTCNILGICSNDKTVRGEDFDMIRPLLIRNLKPLFPNNKLIQGLPETGLGITANQ